MSDVILADIAKNGRERIRVSVNEFRGSRYCDIRNYAIDSAGALVPTPKGVAIRRDMIPGIIAALQEAERQIGGRT